MRVDVHAHYFPLAYVERTVQFDPKRRTRGAAGAPAPGASFHVGAAEQIELMDAAGIDRQVLSLGSQMPYFPNRDQGTEAARLANDLYAEHCQRHAGRFQAFVALPLPHVDPSLEELERGLGELACVGVALGCSVLGQPLDDPAFDPVFAALERRSAVVFLHPLGGSGATNSGDFGLDWMVGSRFEDTIAAARLVLSGLTLRYPRIRFVVPHLGGTLSLFLQRMDNVAGREAWGKDHPDLAPSEVLKRMWFDTVNEHPVALRCACEAFGADRLVLGTDWPFLPPERLAHGVSYIHEALPAADAEAVLERNAAALLGLGEPARSR